MTLPLPTFSEVIEQAPDAITLVDAGGIVVYANGRLMQMFGLTPADIVGKSIETLIPERLRAKHAAFRDTYIGAPRVRAMGDIRLTLAARRADATEFPVDIQLAPIQSNDKRWTVAVIRDATERHAFLDELRDARQMAERVSRLKGEFLSMAAHDLSQPVQTLELLVSSIEHRVPPQSEVAELLGHAAFSLSQMRQLLKMLSDISRMESGSLRIIPEPVPVDSIFTDLERQFATLAQSKSLRYISNPCHHVVETDPALLRTILANLVANAIRYTPRGEVQVGCFASPTGSLHLVVSDTGIGIPEDQLRTIFEDFYRLDEARRAHRDGFGLGLGIVRRLSGLLELPVTVNSRIGHGSTFDVEIPAQKVLRAA
jgi:PAS domain S-box-containing protein